MFDKENYFPILVDPIQAILYSEGKFVFWSVIAKPSTRIHSSGTADLEHKGNIHITLRIFCLTIIILIFHTISF